MSLAAPRKEEVDGNMENKTFNQFVTEAKRGRPRKLKPGEQADTEHLQDQLSKLTHANHVVVHFKNGEKHDIPRAHANKALIHLSGLKPIHRADHVEHMHGSKENFYHTLATKSIPSKKKTITLAGPKIRKEEAEQIDELEKKTLASYAKKAGGTSMDSVGGLMYQAANADPTAKDGKRVGLFKKAGIRAKGVERAISRLAKESKDEPPFDNPTEKPSTPYTNPHAKAKQLARSIMKKMKEKKAVKEETKKLEYHPHTEADEDPKNKSPFAKNVQAKLKQAKLKQVTKEETETDEKKKKDHHKLLQKFRHRIDEVKAIKGAHATKVHAAPVINPGRVGYTGHPTKPKVQRLAREDYAPLENGQKQVHVDQKTVDSKARKQGAEKPKKPKMELTKEGWALYDSLSDKNKAIFEKMDVTERDRLLDKYISGKR